MDKKNLHDQFNGWHVFKQAESLRERFPWSPKPFSFYKEEKMENITIRNGKRTLNQEIMGQRKRHDLSSTDVIVSGWTFGNAKLCISEMCIFVYESV